MNSVRYSASSESHYRPTPPTPFALILGEVYFRAGVMHERRCARANRATQIAKRDI
jgi:hypothetical protein